MASTTRPGPPGISSWVGRKLDGIQPRLLKSTYELRNGRRVIGTLTFRSIWGTLATAELAGGCWTFKRTGFLRTQVSVRECGSDTNIAVFRPNSWKPGGRLELSTERGVVATGNFWGSRYEFRVRQEPLVRYELRQRIKLSGHMEIMRAAADMAEAPWIGALGWYLAVLVNREGAAGA